MTKNNIRVNPKKCIECHACQLRCSLAYTGAFNPERARIILDPPKEVSFTEDCIENCTLCARYCPVGALMRVT